MPEISSIDLESLLDDAELRLARRKRWALALTIVPALLAIALVVTSVDTVRKARRRTAELEARASKAISLERAAREKLTEVETQVASANAGLDTTRRAAQNLGIVLFHQGNYLAAIRAYDSALQVDPGNVYLVNLKAYAYFKRQDYGSAAAALEKATKQDPTYAHAFFDLARVQCATGDLAAAKTSAARAMQLSQSMHDEMAADGEFIRLCRPILQDLGLPAVPTE